jgi:O-antigen/teichoic acid export membrane protein
MAVKKILTFRQRVLQSGSWTLAGYGISQVLRLGGNLILTRLLFPEAFGLMAIFQAVSFGVVMLSDVGIGPSIIQKERGNEPGFLNTAWTIQIVRGFLACVVLCALALPMAKLYGEPLLVSMLPVAGLIAIISGFTSTKVYTAQRNMEAVRVTQMDIGTYAIGLLCTIFLAWLLKSVWALVWGGVITSILKMAASHIFLHGIRNQFAWDRDAVNHLRGFGRWILLGSALTFFSIEGARLIIGAMLDMRQLALFTLASTMSLLFWQAMQQLAGRVYFPAYSEVFRTNPKNLASVLYKARLTIVFPSWCLAVLFLFFGSPIMDTLYDARYHGSGFMLELLAAGLLVRCLWGSYSGVLLAMGKAATETMLTAIQIAFQISGIYIGYHYWGGAGIVIGVAAANWVMYPVNAFVMARNGLWQPKLDFAFIAASVMTVVLAWPRLIENG